jgi:signal recognition particle subunit SRP54
MIQSMTPEERANPGIINPSRKIRIAKGSGKDVQDINRLLKQFDEMRKMMHTMTSGQGGKRSRMAGLSAMRR